MSSRRCLSIAVGLAFAVYAPAASAAVRYTSPGGTSTAPCTSSQPCDLMTAMEGASDGDEVVVGPGDYGSPSARISPVQDGARITVHGEPGQPRPRLYIATAGSPAFSLSHAGSSAADLYINGDNGSTGVFTAALALANGTSADRIFAEETRTGGANVVGCEVDEGGTGNTLRDSVCFGTGGAATDDGVLVQAFFGNCSLALRNVTAYGTETGIAMFAGAGLTASLTATNTIAHGGSLDVVTTEFGTGAAATATLDHSNYANVAPGTPTDITPNTSNGNQSSPPSLVDPANGDFHEQPGSPTVDAGANDSANGAADLDGVPRIVNGATDIGAYELPLAPSVTTGPASAIGATAATLSGSVDPNGLDTSVVAQYGTTTSYGSQTSAASLAASGSAQPVSFSLSGLRPGTTYHYRVVATNSIGTALGADATFTTPKARPRGLTLKSSPTHPRGQPLQFKVKGNLLLPAHVPTTVCTGKLKLQIRSKGHRTEKQALRLKHNCTYSAKLKLQFAGSGTLKLRLSFPGNRSLTAISKKKTLEFG